MTTTAKKPVRTGKYTWDLPMILRTCGAWIIALLMFFPIFFMIVTSFKTELQAIAVPSLWIFEPTLENFTEIQERSDYFSFAWNSVLSSVVSTALGLAIATPAAYSMAFNPTKQTKNILDELYGNMPVYILRYMVYNISGIYYIYIIYIY